MPITDRFQNPDDLDEDVLNRADLRQGGRCATCGTDLSETERRAHHRWPLTLQEQGNPDNCVWFCEACHLNVAHGGDLRRYLPLNDERDLPWLRGGRACP